MNKLPLVNLDGKTSKIITSLNYPTLDGLAKVQSRISKILVPNRHQNVTLLLLLDIRAHLISHVKTLFKLYKNIHAFPDK